MGMKVYELVPTINVALSAPHQKGGEGPMFSLRIEEAPITKDKFDWQFFAGVKVSALVLQEVATSVKHQSHR